MTLSDVGDIAYKVGGSSPSGAENFKSRVQNPTAICLRELYTRKVLYYTTGHSVLAQCSCR